MFIQKEISVTVRGKGIHDITSIVNEAIKKNEVSKGICNLFIKHTSASLIIQENADPAVLEDLNNFYDKLVPENDQYIHSQEGPDDMPAHIRSTLTNSDLNIPIKNNSLELGTWQGVYLFEHRRPKYDSEITRKLTITIMA
tara:strand:+ start:809 stop:1231 length:423 start_codon:yes stop_codon:yes gene_type:complete